MQIRGPLRGCVRKAARTDSGTCVTRPQIQITWRSSILVETSLASSCGVGTAVFTTRSRSSGTILPVGGPTQESEFGLCETFLQFYQRQLRTASCELLRTKDRS